MITMSPCANAEAMAIINELYGSEALLAPYMVPFDYESPTNHPIVKPIDAEAVYLNPRMGLTNSNACFGTIMEMLRRHKGACFIAGVGALGVGQISLEQAAHHVASGESLSRFRQTVYLAQHMAEGPPVSFFEPETQ